MPNPWDAGSARVLAQLGFPALATTSAGMAWAMGRRDNDVPLDDVARPSAAIAAAVDVPVNADFEGGFAVAPEGCGGQRRARVATGVAGLSIEDSTGDADEPLYPFALAVDRVRAARQAIDASGTGVLLTGRSEGFIAGRPDLAETVRRLVAYAEAGAECLYAPGHPHPRGDRDGGARRGAAAGERAGAHRLRHRARAGGARRAAHQRRRRAGPGGLGRVHERRRARLPTTARSAAWRTGTPSAELNRRFGRG